jgi:hypothetical protein
MTPWENVDGRDEPGHDALLSVNPALLTRA